VDHERNSRGGVVRAYQGSGDALARSLGGTLPPRSREVQ
jgi:hypothetical protein